MNHNQDNLFQKLNELTKKDNDFNKILNTFNKKLKTYKLKHADHNKYGINKEKNSLIVFDYDVKDDIDYTTTFQLFLNKLDNSKKVHIILLMNVIPYYLMRIISLYAAENNIVVYLEPQKYNLWKKSEFYDDNGNHPINCELIDKAVELKLISKP